MAKQEKTVCLSVCLSVSRLEKLYPSTVQCSMSLERRSCYGVFVRICVLSSHASECESIIHIRPFILLYSIAACGRETDKFNPSLDEKRIDRFVFIRFDMEESCVYVLCHKWMSQLSTKRKKG